VQKYKKYLDLQQKKYVNFHHSEHSWAADFKVVKVIKVIKVFKVSRPGMPSRRAFAI